VGLLVWCELHAEIHVAQSYRKGFQGDFLDVVVEVVVEYTAHAVDVIPNRHAEGFGIDCLTRKGLIRQSSNRFKMFIKECSGVVVVALHQ